MPGELFPTRFRSTAYGITAAIGKLAAVVSYLGFAILFDVGMDENPKRTFYWSIILAVAMSIGMFFIYSLPETNGRPLEDNNANSDDTLE